MKLFLHRAVEKKPVEPLFSEIVCYLYDNIRFN